MKNLLVLFSLVTIRICEAQNVPISNADFKDWQYVNPLARISSDGKYYMCKLTNEVPGFQGLYISSLNGSHKEKVITKSVYNYNFTDDSKYAFYLAADSLFIVNLKKFDKRLITNVLTCTLIEKESNYLLYRTKGTEDATVVFDLTSGESYSFPYTKQFFWCPKDQSAIVLLKDPKSPQIQQIGLKEFKSGSMTRIWEGKNLAGLSMSNDRRKLVFSILDTANRVSFYYYEKDRDAKPVLLANDSILNLPPSIKLANVEAVFSEHDDKLLIYCEDATKWSKSPLESKIHLWSYRDVKIPASIELVKRQMYLLTIKDKVLRKIADKDERFIIENRPQKWNRNFASVEILDRNGYPESYNLVSLSDTVKTNFKYRFSVSPNGKFIVYYNSLKHHYFSYEISSKKLRQLDLNQSIDWIDNRNEVINGHERTRGIAGWVGDSEILIYSSHDIWIFDLHGHKRPSNITNNFGQRKRILFHLGLTETSTIWISKPNSLILSAFNTETKQNGFYKVKKVGQDPEQLTMGPYIYFAPDVIRTSNGIMPYKAKNAEVYIVSRMSDRESPNFFMTKDFRTFQQLTFCYPERKFNWLRKELHEWRSLNGDTLKGILIKPDNFDSTKKYPVIFYIYEKFSDGLYEYIKPELSDGRLNIPWYVSNNYLVFLPDIKFRIGHPGESALSSVLPAVHYLSARKYVDNRRLGIQGMSFGGFLCNYIVTHSNVFAAACTSVGGSDFISYYGDLHSGLVSQQTQFEDGQYRIGAALIDKPELYIENSPVFSVRNVTCPILLFHTTVDGAVPFRQAVEMFTGLKRAGKVAWLLQYDEGNHSVQGKYAEDFNLRLQQYFNHFLKNHPSPKWMTLGDTNIHDREEFGLQLEAMSEP